MAFVRGASVTGFTFALVNKANGNAVTAGVSVGKITKDGGTQADLVNLPVHEGNGQWSVDLTSDEMDAVIVGLLFLHDDAIPVQFTIRTVTAATTGGAGSSATTSQLAAGIFTYADAVEHLVDHIGGAPDAAGQTQIRKAIVNAYREICQQPQGWNYFLRKHRLYLQAAYSTGTVEYIHATRTLTLTDGTWPSWAAFGEVRVGTTVHEVDARDSDTVLTLDPNNNPGEDVAAGTSFSIEQTVYPLPSDFQSLVRVEGEDWFQRGYITPGDWMTLDRHAPSTSTPYCWTIMGMPHTYGRLALAFHPAPSDFESADFIYRRRPRDIRRTGYDEDEYTGTVEIVDEDVTGTGTNFRSRFVGSLMRLTIDTDEPPTGLGGLNPYDEEVMIQAVGGTTELTLAQAPTGTYSGTKFRITDPLDMDAVMVQAFLRRAEFEMALMLNRGESRIAAAEDMYRRELTRALENDIRRPIQSGVAWPESMYDPGEGGSAGYGVTYTVTV